MFRTLIISVAILTNSFFIQAKADNSVTSNIQQQYSLIKQTGLDKLNIKPVDIYPLIKKINSKRFRVTEAGRSYLDKPIYEIQVGNGPLKVLMWSQMHGNEPTATASLFDFINYINDPANEQWYQSWKEKITLHLVPMINPDGADLNQRYNAQDIDINRDATRLQTSEGRLLNHLADSIKPMFGFNLHDQGRFYTVGESSNTATISFLAPAFNDEKDIDKSRHQAMQLIGLLNDAIQQQYPNHVSRYDDTYSFRAFGDLFSSKGIATTLIESGHYQDDPSRQVARWLTFLSLVRSVDLITSGDYQSETLDKYHDIPFSTNHDLVDIMLRNINIEGRYLSDIAINFDYNLNNPRVIEIGDLSQDFGLQTLDLVNYQYQAIEGFILDKPLVLSTEKYHALLQKGFGYFIGDAANLDIQTKLPVVLKSEANKTKNDAIPQRHQTANFMFKSNGIIKIAIIEGVVIKLSAQ